MNLLDDVNDGAGTVVLRVSDVWTFSFVNTESDVNDDVTAGVFCVSDLCGTLLDELAGAVIEDSVNGIVLVSGVWASSLEYLEADVTLAVSEDTLCVVWLRDDVTVISGSCTIDVSPVVASCVSETCTDLMGDNEDSSEDATDAVFCFVDVCINLGGKIEEGIKGVSGDPDCSGIYVGYTISRDAPESMLSASEKFETNYKGNYLFTQCVNGCSDFVVEISSELNCVAYDCAVDNFKVDILMVPYIIYKVE